MADIAGALPPSPLTALGLPLAVVALDLLLIVLGWRTALQAHHERLRVQEALLAERLQREQVLEAKVAERTQALGLALADSQRAQEQRTRLLAYVGHDLRSPLVSTLQWARRLGSPTASAPEQARLVGSIERGVGYQLALIDDLIELARGELETLEIVAAPTYLHSLLAEVAEQAQALAAQRGNQFELERRGPLPGIVVLDAKRVRQVLMNLLSNGAKYCAQGRLRLEVSAAPAEPALLRFEVVDSGPGIDASTQQRLFTPFVRGDEAVQSQPGSGLGLAIARQIVSHLGGALVLESSDGRGSRFSFTLPLHSAPESELLQPPLRVPGAPPFGAGLRVLLVDDDDSSRERLAEVLHAADFEVLHATSAEQALVLAAEEPRPDLVLTDERLPGELGGAALARRLARIYGDAAPPVVLASAWPAAPGHTFAATFLKPVVAEELIDALAVLTRRPAAAR
jgi:signal transduction histidine kinase